MKKQSVKVKRAGRPPKPEDEVLDAIIPATRCKSDERVLFEKAAKREGLKLTQWIRQTLKDAVTE